MQPYHIHLLSCRTREMNTDLMPLYQYGRADDRFRFHTFVSELSGLNHEENNDRLSRFTLDPAAVPPGNSVFICNDISLGNRLPAAGPANRNALIITPNNYYYQLKTDEALRTSPATAKRLAPFGLILVPNPMIEALIRSDFTLSDRQKLLCMPTPYARSLTRPEQCAAKKEAFIRCYPKAKDKKLLFLMLVGTPKAEIRDQFSKWCLEELSHILGDDWIIATNSPMLLIGTDLCDDAFYENFIYIRQNYTPEDLLYHCDALITNLPFLAHAQASRELPVFCMAHNGNAFEQYMKENHGNLYFDSVSGLLEATESLLNPALMNTPVMSSFLAETINKAETDPVPALMNYLCDPA